MAIERTEVGGICWRVPNPNEAGPYYCETCGPVVLRESGRPGAMHVGADPRDMPADAVCGRCGYGLKGEVAVLEAEPFGRGEGRCCRAPLGKEVQLGGIQSRHGFAEAFQTVCVQARSISLRAGLEVAEGATSQKAPDVLAREGTDRPEQVGIAGAERQFQIAPLGVPAGVVGEIDGFEALHRSVY